MWLGIRFCGKKEISISNFACAYPLGVTSNSDMREYALSSSYRLFKETFYPM